MRTHLAILAAATLAAACGSASDEAAAPDDDAAADVAGTPTAAADGAAAPTGPDPATSGTVGPATGPTADPADTTDPVEPGAGSSTTDALATPAYRGTLSFDSVRTVDLAPFLAERGLRGVNARATLSRDGDTARLDVTDDLGAVVAVAAVDTRTGAPSWTVTDLSPDTVVLFDANQVPVAVAGLGCEPAAYEGRFDGAVVNLGALVPAGRCMSSAPEVSADGNVALFRTYDPELGTRYLAPGTRLHAYTLDTAALVELPDAVLERDGVTLTPRSLDDGGRPGRLSDDGARYFARTWWEGIDAGGAAVRETGAVLWDTATGTWQTRGARADLRGCTPTDRVSCAPAYSYAVSSDGAVQYAEVPTARPYALSSGSPFRPFSTLVEVAGTDAPEPVALPGLEDATGLVTNDDGALLLANHLRDADGAAAGYHLHRPGTGERVSLNRALNACPETDGTREPIAVEDCRFTSVPASIENDPAAFTADGTSLIIRSVSRFDADAGQEVESLLLDVDTGATYSIPGNYSSDTAAVSADASVFLGLGDYPGYELLIGRR